MAANTEKNGVSLYPLFSKLLPTSPVIELLAKSQLENKEEIRIFLSKNEEIGFEKYLKKIIRSLNISDVFKFRTKKIWKFLISGKTLSEIKNVRTFFYD